MTPFWLELGVIAWVVALAGLAAAFGSVTLLFAQRQRRAAEGLRRLVMDQLLFAARRGLPLARALAVLGEELDRQGEPHPDRPLLLAPLLWLPRRFERGGARWQARAVHDLAADLEEGDLRCLSRVPRGAFPDPLPALLSRAERQGTLLATLEELCRLDDEALRLRGEVRGQLLYPTWILFVGLLAVLFMDVVVWGRLGELLEIVGDRSRVAAIEGLVLVRRALVVALPLLLGATWLGAGALVTGRGALVRRLLPGTRGVARALDRRACSRTSAGRTSRALRARRPGRALPPAAAERALARAERRATAWPRGAWYLLDRTALERLPAAPGGPHELAALADVADAASRAAAARVDLLARATLPVALGLIGALAGVTYAAPHLVYNAVIAVEVPW
ncbi:MAG: type II secretion system F family protein [Planctomycetes bacterium]|nr:type II secretion system F family protein [Planctomycetota bacterium]